MQKVLIAILIFLRHAYNKLGNIRGEVAKVNYMLGIIASSIARLFKNL
jgi:hypothetical protein